jgi:hypothetical protein
MARPSARFAVTVDAITSVLEMLSAIPESEEQKKLLDEARACEVTARAWQDAPPSKEEREAVMKRVLHLHVAAAGLRRSSPPGPIGGGS